METESGMNEKVYKVMGFSGVTSVVTGVVVVVTGVAAGVMMIVGGARLLREKSRIIF